MASEVEVNLKPTACSTILGHSKTNPREMNSPPEGPKKINKFNKRKAKRLYTNSLATCATKKSDSLKPKTLGKLTRTKKTKENVKKAVKHHTKNPPRFAKKEQGKMKSMAQVFDSKTRKSTAWDSGSANNSSQWDQGAKSNSRSHWDQGSKSNSGSHWDQGSKSNSSSHWDQGSKSNSSSHWDQASKSNSGYHKPKPNRWDQVPQSYSANSWQSGPGYNGYDNWGYYGYANNGYDKNGYDKNGYDKNGYDLHWGYDKPENPLYHLYQNHVKSNEWKSAASSANGSHSQNGHGSFQQSAGSSGYGQQRQNGKGSFHPSASSKPNGHGSFHPSANSKPKRPLQTIEEAKREKEEAAKVAQEMKNKEEIAAKKSKLEAALKAKKNEGNQVKFTFSTGHWSPSNKEQERERPQQELNDFNLTPGDLAQIGRGKNVANTLVEDEPPPVLPVYVNCLAAVPVTTEGEVQERPRVAYNKSTEGEVQERPRVAYNKSRSSPSTSDGEERPMHSAVAKGRTSFRSRTVSESNKRVGVAAKRIRKASEQNSRSLELPETRAEKDVYDIGKFKQALLKMNKRELSELVNSPTSSKSKILMSALVRDHRRLIAQRLNQVRFNCTSKMLVSMGENLDNASSLLEVELPPELLVHISDIIKMEVPDVEIIAEKLTRKEAYAILAIKEEQPADHTEIKKEIGDEDRAYADEVIEVPVPPKPTPPVVDLETTEETKADDNAMDIAQSEIEDNGHPKNKSITKKKTKDVGDAKDSYKGRKEGDAMKANESDELVPFEGLRREPRKRGRPKNGEIRRNLGQEIIVGTIDTSENESSNDSEASPSSNKKKKVQEEEPREKINGHVDEANVPISSDEGSNERNLRLIFEEESRLWSEFKANREELDKLQANETNILQRMEFLNELKRQMFKF